MVGTGAPNGVALRNLAPELMKRDQADTPGRYAGPPFELPYTLALPDREADRWHLHLELIKVSSDLIAKIEAAAGPHALLTDYKRFDGEGAEPGRRQAIEQILQGNP